MNDRNINVHMISFASIIHWQAAFVPHWLQSQPWIHCRATFLKQLPTAVLLNQNWLSLFNNFLLAQDLRNEGNQCQCSGGRHVMEVGWTLAIAVRIGPHKKSVRRLFHGRGLIRYSTWRKRPFRSFGTIGAIVVLWWHEAIRGVMWPSTVWVLR